MNYFKDRFARAGMSPRNASLAQLYAAVLAGDPRKINARDQNGSARQAVPQLQRQADQVMAMYGITDGMVHAMPNPRTGPGPAHAALTPPAVSPSVSPESQPESVQRQPQAESPGGDGAPPQRTSRVAARSTTPSPVQGDHTPTSRTRHASSFTYRGQAHRQRRSRYRFHARQMRKYIQAMMRKHLQAMKGRHHHRQKWFAAFRKGLHRAAQRRSHTHHVANAGRKRRWLTAPNLANRRKHQLAAI